jgi:dihydropyrimidine dehydrogenase (NADP+)/dihydropyrimidine dehydrogenase (NAD+) subunit PreA
VQVCTGVMKFGYQIIHPMKEQLMAFMESHKFERLEDFKGYSVQFFTTHADLVKRQAEARAAKKAEHDRKKVVRSDEEWQGDDFVKQTDALARG